MPNLVLIGYRCTGKTTVGKLVAKRLKLSHVDADDALEQRAGRSIRDIFAENGEDFFRDLEVEVIQHLIENNHTVISLGGGAVLRRENREVIRSHVTVWLQASAESIWKRMNTDATTGERRPALTGRDGYEEIVELLAAREPLYRECADFSVDTEQKKPAELADEIVDLLGDDFSHSTG